MGHSRVGGRRHPDLLLGGRRVRGPPRIRQLQQVQQQLLQVRKGFLGLGRLGFMGKSFNCDITLD